MAVVAGTAIFAASFLLLWACDAAQKDIPQALALAVVALIAVLPEYAVDMYFTWEAGRQPESQYSQFAIANMTGANRLLIGVGWSTIVVLFWLKFRRCVSVERDQTTALFFLSAATVYAFVIPLKGTLAWYDGVVFLGLYGWYIVVAGRQPCAECEVGGPAELLMQLPALKRRVATLTLFVVSATAIVANSKPFCEGLIQTGALFKINQFFLVQWLAPIASEAPEFIVAIMFAWRGRGGMALGTLVSSKLNQWTLLVGMIPGVFAVAHGSLDHPIPMGHFQMNEILLTAAQSLLAVVLLAVMRLSLGRAALLFVLFAGQLVAPPLVEKLPSGTFMGIGAGEMHAAFSVIYLVAAAVFVLSRPAALLNLARGLSSSMSAVDPRK
jgi:cation:H+ antiporter